MKIFASLLFHYYTEKGYKIGNLKNQCLLRYIYIYIYNTKMYQYLHKCLVQILVHFILFIIKILTALYVA